MEYEAIIGMEVHAQLLTKSKMFCSCDADFFGAEPNTHVCPVCMALPGALPVINREAVKKTILTGLALNCSIAEDAVFARKNYMYPDLPKGYQISQYELPLTVNGWLQIEGDDGKPKIVRIRRAHLEEDTGKLVHVEGASLVDFNRAGVPLLEIVSEPDMRSADEAYRYLLKLRTILRYLGVSTADMEKGAMRCEANVSVRPAGSDVLGTKVEVKNLNSFRSVRQALEYEIKRQIETIESGGRVVQVTMGWDMAHGHTVVQRSKEEAHDYRYFPEPDLPPLHVEREWVEEIAECLPELPDAKRDRFVRQYGLEKSAASTLVEDRSVADYFEETASSAEGIPPAQVANWIAGELFHLLNAAGVSIGDQPVTPKRLAGLLKLVASGAINQNTGKDVLKKMFQTGENASTIVERDGLAQVRDEDALLGLVRRIISENSKEADRYRSGKVSIIGWFVGQAMRETHGKADPKLVRELFQRELGR